MNCRRCRCWLLLVPLLLLAGCQGSEEITQYQVPRPKPREKGRGLPAALPKFEAPANWNETPPKHRDVKVAYLLPGPDGTSAEVSISALAGDGGGLTINYQRWQRQLGLEPTEPPKDLKKTQAAGEEALLVDLLGPTGRDQQRIQVIVLKQGASTWYFKLKAPAEGFAKPQAAFEAFVKTVRF